MYIVKLISVHEQKKIPTYPLLKLFTKTNITDDH